MGADGFTRLGELTLGELFDLYDGWLWRTEREIQDQLGFTLMIMQTCSMGDTSKITAESLLKRPPFPSLRSLQTEPTVLPPESRGDLDPLDQLKGVVGGNEPVVVHDAPPTNQSKIQQDLKDLKDEFKGFWKKQKDKVK